MAYIQELLQTQQQIIEQQQQVNTDLGLGNRAYAQYFPTWEVGSPQYQIPQAWTLSQLGYKTNEVAYACISLKMKSISEPPIRIYDKVEEEFIDDSKNEEFFRFMEMPCPDVTETDFHAANQMYLDIAGFMAWEKDMTNGGDLLAVWPIMPQYASFKRGQGQLLRAIQYLPYTGLPAYDIMRERIVIMMYFDPQYFGLKPLSPTAVLADVIGVDNNMTKMVEQFMKNAGFLSGLLKTEQIINEADATFAKERWREVHGGPQNAGNIAVLGKGLEFQSSGNTFRDMVFPEVDARSETRICMGYGVPPILVSAKSGMDRATYSNYEQARKAWYEEYVTSQWKFLAERYTKDILPHFDTDTNHVLRFDLKNIKALQEDRTNQWKRAIDAYRARAITRNNTLVEMGMEQLEDEVLGGEYYQTVMEQLAQTNSLDVKDDSQSLDEKGKPIAKEEKPAPKKKSDDEEDKSIIVYKPDANLVIEGLRHVIKSISSAKMMNNPQHNITVNIQPNEPPKVTIEPANIEVNVPEQKSIFEVPVPVINVEVNPTPIEVEVNTPKLKRSISTEKVKRDNNFNIDGKVGETQFEYEDDE